MFLRHKIRIKDGKRHRYWSVVENKRVAGGRVVQKHVLHLARISQSIGASGLRISDKLFCDNDLR